MDAVTCPNCGNSNDPSQRFCGQCGTPLRTTCRNCGQENPLAFRFCGSCGTALAEAPPAPAAAAPSEERRWATVLFADISGFTSMSERMDPEDVKSFADRCAARLSEDVRRFGGTVVSVMGDAIMAVFGAPLAHEDDPERAVRAGLSMLEAIGTVAGAEPLDLHIGVNSGEVMAGLVGPEGRRDYTVMGDTTNTASRLMSAAPRGQLLVGEETFRASEHAIRYQEVPPIEAKGKDVPVRAWRALEAIAGPAERPVSAAPLIGRDRELSLLEDVWRRVRDERRPHLVTVFGPPGIGKTRLMLELQMRLVPDDVRFLRGRSLPYGESTGYGAFTQHVMAAAGIVSTDPVPRAREKLREHIRALFDGDQPEIDAHLSATVGLAPNGTIADQQVVFFSIRRYAEQLARQQPTVLVFEDIHWADATLLQLIESMAGRAHEAPLLVLCLARPDLFEARPTWGAGQSAYTAITLEPLSERASTVLATRLLGARVDAAQRLTETAGGNPLFIEELAASVAEQTAEAAATLPSNVQAIIGARLDSLPSDVRRVVQDAAVVGKLFWAGALRELSAEPQRLPAILDDLEARDLIRREATSALAGEDEYAFKHMLIREVAYLAIPKVARRERHAKVARFLERALGERAVEAAALLAYHWREAGELEPAVRYLLSAADRAGRAWAKTEAVDLYGQALELLTALGDEARVADVRRKRAAARVEAGDYARAREDLDELLPQTEGTERAQLLFYRARAAYWLADAESVHRYGEMASQAAAEIGDPLLEARALASTAEGVSMSGDVPAAIALSHRALETWPRAGRDIPDYAYAHALLGLQYYWNGDLEPAVEYARAGFDLARERQALIATLNGGAHLGMALGALGRYEEAFEALDETVALGMELEAIPRFTGRAANMWAGLYRDVMDPVESRRQAERGLELGTEGAFQAAMISARIDLMLLDLDEGEVGRPQRAWEELWGAAEATKGWHQWLWQIRLAQARAEMLRVAGRLDDAIAAAHDARERAATLRPKYRATATLTLGRALLDAGRPEDAADALSEALDHSRRIKHARATWETAAALGRALYAAGRDDASAEAYRTARETIESISNRLSPERQERFLAAEPVAEVLTVAR